MNSRRPVNFIVIRRRFLTTEKSKDLLLLVERVTRARDANHRWL